MSEALELLLGQEQDFNRRSKTSGSSVSAYGFAGPAAVCDYRLTGDLG
jgi:hypothetical protein